MESILQGTSVTLSEIDFEFYCQSRELFKYQKIAPNCQKVS